MGLGCEKCKLGNVVEIPPTTKYDVLKGLATQHSPGGGANQLLDELTKKYCPDTAALKAPADKTALLKLFTHVTAGEKWGADEVKRLKVFLWPDPLQQLKMGTTKIPQFDEFFKSIEDFNKSTSKMHTEMEDAHSNVLKVAQVANKEASGVADLDGVFKVVQKEATANQVDLKSMINLQTMTLNLTAGKGVPSTGPLGTVLHALQKLIDAVKHIIERAPHLLEQAKEFPKKSQEFATQAPEAAKSAQLNPVECVNAAKASAQNVEKAGKIIPILQEIVDSAKKMMEELKSGLQSLLR